MSHERINRISIERGRFSSWLKTEMRYNQRKTIGFIHPLREDFRKVAIHLGFHVSDDGLSISNRGE